jgi:hypothetical protein
MAPAASSVAAAPAGSSVAAHAPAASSVAAGAAASPSAAAGAAASSSNTKAKKKQKKGTFTTVTAETLRASKNASRYMGAFKVVGSQESVHGPIAKQ